MLSVRVKEIQRRYLLFDKHSISWSKGLFVYFSVQFVKHLVHDFLQVTDVCSIVILGDIATRHTSNILVKTLKGFGNGVECPAAEEGRQNHCGVEQDLVIHNVTLLKRF
jgi:hypothetical protein